MEKHQNPTLSPSKEQITGGAIISNRPRPRLKQQSAKKPTQAQVTGGAILTQVIR